MKLVLNIALAISVVVNVLAVRDIRALGDRAARMQRAREATIGVDPGPIKGYSINGWPLDLHVSEGLSDGLIFVFSAHCAACAANWENWEKIPGRMSSAWVDLGNDVTPEFAANHGMRVVVTRVSAESRLAWKLVETPQVILMRHGRVRDVWTGWFGKTEQDQLAREMEEK